jgi:hypothetical protein
LLSAISGGRHNIQFELTAGIESDAGKNQADSYTQVMKKHQTTTTKKQQVFAP